MDDFDRDSNASSDNEQQDHDDNMTNDEGDDMDVDRDDPEEEEQDNEEEEEDQDDGEPEQEQEQEQEEQSTNDDNTATTASSATLDRPEYLGDALQTPRIRPTIRPQAITAKVYDIVPTMAAPQSTSINDMAVTPDLRYWITGGSDGYIRKYDGPGTINGKQLLTVAQRHPFVDSVVKAGILMSYWENKEQPVPNARGGVSSDSDDALHPVHSLAVQHQALWLLSGSRTGSINLWSVRHDEGKIIHALRRSPGGKGEGHEYMKPVSVLSLAPDEQSVLSGSWDKQIYDWDLNSGKIKRSFTGAINQISVIELRPLGGSPIPPEASTEPLASDTFSSNARPLPNGAYTNGINGLGAVNGSAAPVGGHVGDAPGFDDDNESLFGSEGGGGSLFGDDNDMRAGGGTNVFGEDNDNDFSEDAMLTMPGEGTDTAMGDAPHPDPESVPAPAVQPPPDVLSTTAHTSGSNGNAAAPHPSQADAQTTQPEPPPSSETAPPHSPTLVFNSQPQTSTAGHDPNQMSPYTFLSASADGALRIWDRRVPNPIARIGCHNTPPYCMGACWSPDGDNIYVGRRNGTVEEFSIHRARGGNNWLPERVLRFPPGSGAVSCVRPMPNGRHLICASHDILRLWDLKDQSSSGGRHSSVPFLVVPGPPRAGVISSLYLDPTCRFMITTAGHRGTEASNTECLIGYEIGCIN